MSSNAKDGRSSGVPPMDSLDEELWRLCAAPHLVPPRVGEIVHYFPQGHAEQVSNPVEDAALDALAAEYNLPPPMTTISNQKLPSEFLCRVGNVSLKAMKETDELFAEVMLVPESSEMFSEKRTPIPPRNQFRSFCKTLTASDASSHGGFSLHRRHAEFCFPPLDMSNPVPSQILIAKDIHGVEWQFRHIYRGDPKRHLLQNGWSVFVSGKNLAAGDAVIFVRGDNDELRVGVRRAQVQETRISSTLISSQSMQLGVLALAWHAVSLRSMFSFYYKPKICPSDYIIPHDKYLESLRNKYSIGMQFITRSGDDEARGRSFTGTIVNIRDLDPERWPGSKWRCLEVSWHDASATRPSRISPWEIEPYRTASPLDYLPMHISKRSRPNTMPSSSNTSVITRCGNSPMVAADSHQLTRTTNSVLDQEIAASNESYNIQNDVYALRGLPSYLDFLPGFRRSCELYGSYRSLSELAPCYPDSLIPTTLTMMPSSSEIVIKPQHLIASQNKLESPKNIGTCMLFGVPLGNPVASGAVQFRSHCDGVSDCTLPIIASPPSRTLESEQVIEMSLGTRSTDSEQPQICLQKHADVVKDGQNKLHGSTIRTSTKVQKQGFAISRSVNLRMFNSYSGLLAELDTLFEFRGELIGSRSNWTVTYFDKEGNQMLVGGDPWDKFCEVAHKIYICTHDDVTKISSGTSSQSENNPSYVEGKGSGNEKERAFSS